MKQHITLKQWDEITKEQKNILWDSGFQRDWKMNISQMMEFLHNSFNEISLGYDNSGCFWIVVCGHNGTGGMIEGCEAFKSSCENESLCDALWEAVKYKLK